MSMTQANLCFQPVETRREHRQFSILIQAKNNDVLQCDI